MSIYWQVKRELDKIVNFDYRNSIIARGFEQGKQDQMTEDWIKNRLLDDIKEGFITYSQAVAIRPIYIKTIETLRNSIR